MFDISYDRTVLKLQKELGEMIDLRDINIVQWQQFIGLDIELTNQKDFLKHAKRMMGFTWEDFAAWLTRDKGTLLHYVYTRGEGRINHLDYIKRGFILYQLREYYRHANIRSTLVHSKYWNRIHYDR